VASDAALLLLTGDKASLLAARSMGWSRLSSTSGRCRLSAWGLAMRRRDVRPSRRSGCLRSPVT